MGGGECSRVRGWGTNKGNTMGQEKAGASREEVREGAIPGVSG